MLFLVRNATNRDTEGIVEVIKAVHEEYGFNWYPDGYHADLYDIEAHFWRQGHAFWVAESLGEPPRIIGTGAVTLFEPFPLGQALVEHDGHFRAGGADCSLERLYVHPEIRRVGVGSTLLQHAINWALEHGRKRMEIWSDKSLVAAHKLYEAFGAQLIGERLCHDPEQSPEWGMLLPLRQS